MPQSATPMILPLKSQDGIIEYHKQCYQLLAQQWNIRDMMRQIDLAYIRENDYTVENQRAKIANSYGDSNRLQNVVVPVVMPQVESAVEYQTSVFLQGNPIFGVVASPQFQDEALQIETVIDENATRGGWVRQFQMFFRDNFKYNLAAIEVQWDRKVTAALETNLAFSKSEAKPKEIIWEGNCVNRWDMYNTFFDSRVSPAEMHEKGEFIGKTELMGRVALKQFIQTLPDKMVDNVAKAFASGLGTANIGAGTESYYLPDINPSALLNRSKIATTDWLAWSGLVSSTSNIEYKNIYEITTLYGRIIPQDFNLKVPARNTPQIWKFIIVNHQVLIYAERQTNAHGWLPVLMSQAMEDGLGFQTKSLAQNAKPIQEVSTALMNSVIAARRRAISDRVLYDPSRVAEHHINSDNPSAKIPVRPSAYGKQVSDSVYQFPYRDDQSQISLQELSVLDQMANKITGFNPVRQGQFVKGNKTKREFDSVMSHSNGRDQMTSLLLEHQVMTPLKYILKLNILQYQGGVSLFNRDKAKEVDIDPVKLRKAVLEFKVSDGLVPSEKLVDGDTLNVALQVLGSTPQLATGYNLTPLFSYLMKTQGAHLKDFEKSAEQTAYEQALGVWQNTVSSISEAMIKNLAAVEGMTVEQVAETIQKALPPQPTPEQYKYDPAMGTNTSASGYSKQSAQEQVS
jgi:hypothetical protein